MHFVTISAKFSFVPVGPRRAPRRLPVLRFDVLPSLHDDADRGPLRTARTRAPGLALPDSDSGQRWQFAWAWTVGAVLPAPQLNPQATRAANEQLAAVVTESKIAIVMLQAEYNPTLDNNLRNGGASKLADGYGIVVGLPLLC